MFQASAPALELLTLGNCGAAYVGFFFILGLFLFWFGFFWVFFLEIKKEGDGAGMRGSWCFTHPWFSLWGGESVGSGMEKACLGWPRAVSLSCLGLQLGSGLGAEQRSLFACFKSALNGSSEAWLVPGLSELDVQGRGGSMGLRREGWGWGMAPTLQCPGEGRVWICDFPFLERWRQSLAVPGSRAQGWGPSPDPIGGTGNPPSCIFPLQAAFFPSSCLQPIPRLASAIVDVAELQDSLSEPPGQG